MLLHLLGENVYFDSTSHVIRAYDVFDLLLASCSLVDNSIVG